MNIRQAILKAADHIECKPESYNFGSCSVPALCGSPGCMLGWIGHFAGAPVDSSIGHAALNFLGVSSTEFYARIRSVSIDGYCAYLPADHVAHALRAYADKYHPAESPAIPESVRAIFEMTPEQIRAEFSRDLA